MGIWGFFAGTARKKPPYITPFTADPKEQLISAFLEGSMLTINVTVHSLGDFAARIFEQGGQAVVLGSTSRGCFLLVRSRWMVFLTLAPQRGPLTVNLARDLTELRHIKAGTTVEIDPGGLIFIEPGFHLEMGRALRWVPPGRPGVWLSLEARRIQQASIGEHLLAGKGPAEADASLLMLLDLPVQTGETSDPMITPQAVNVLREAWMNRDLDHILKALEWFLGRGPGLTPAGDDLIAGFLLALHRWGDILCPSLELAELRHSLLPLVYGKTSTLAANLIECASTGQADERLVAALDGLVTGKPDAAECAEALQDYGSSSGRDAFLGMVIASG
jgi:hypothetical protein